MFRCQRIPVTLFCFDGGNTLAISPVPLHFSWYLQCSTRKWASLAPNIKVRSALRTLKGYRLFAVAPWLRKPPQLLHTVLWRTGMSLCDGDNSFRVTNFSVFQAVPYPIFLSSSTHPLCLSICLSAGNPLDMVQVVAFNGTPDMAPIQRDMLMDLFKP